jgi:phenylpropionate dioxygenase-like ring-hydroxylating dioxygenase large terminal subunit
MFSSLVGPVRVNGRVYTDADIFELEFEKIWSKVWIYVGHASEVPAVGDYVRRKVGRQEVILTRGEDDILRVLKNRCIHRANLVCQAPCGNAKVFRCPYHGWTYGNDGHLVGVTYRRGTGGYSSEALEALSGLEPAERVDSYRGLVFASLAPEGPTLKEFLSGTVAAIDRFMDLAPEGTVRLSAGSHKMNVRANWKLFSENQVDRYHATFVHQVTYSLDKGKADWAAKLNSEGPAFVRCFEGGHSELDFSPVNLASGHSQYSAGSVARSEQDFPDLVSALEARLGVEYAKKLLVGGPPHLLVFPNLAFVMQDIRFILPVSVNESTVYQFPAFLDGASDAVNNERLRRHQLAGAVMTDDHEVLERNQRGYSGEGDFSAILERGFGQDRSDDEGYSVGSLLSESPLRNFWNAYVTLMDS